MKSVHCFLYYSKTGGAAFLSHLDTLRVFDRAVRRSGIDVRYTSGFNPHIRLSAGTALPVGLSSRRERLKLLLNREYDAGEVAEAIGRELPTGFCVEDVAFHAEPECAPDELSFEIRHDGTRAQVEQAVARWRGMGLVDVTRKGVDGKRHLDLDAFVDEATVSDSHIRIRIRPGNGVFPRMSDLYRALLLIPGREEAGFDLLDITKL